MYNIELKNQTGESVVYNEIGEVLIPLADKSGEGIFVARHSVEYDLPDEIQKQGGDSCAFGVDLIVLFSSDVSDNLGQANVNVSIGQTPITLFEEESQTNGAVISKGDNLIKLYIPGNIIIGDIWINVEV